MISAGKWIMKNKKYGVTTPSCLFKIKMVIMRKVYLTVREMVSSSSKSKSVLKKCCMLLVLSTLLCFANSEQVQGQTTYYSKASATDFSNPSSWGPNTDGSGISPSSITNADIFIIQNNSSLVLTGSGSSATVSVRSLTLTNGKLTVSGGTLNVTKAGTFNTFLRIQSPSVFTVSGGTVNLNGQLYLESGGFFNQSGGNINVDGNNGGVATGSVTGTSSTTFSATSGNATGAIVHFNVANTASVSLTGGTFTVIDPSQSGNDVLSFSGSFAGQTNTTTGHTWIFGDGVSVDPGGTAGFFFQPWVSTTGFRFGKVIINGGATGANRFVNSPTSFGGLIAIGDLTINANSELRASGTSTPSRDGLFVGGNLTNNGTLTVVVGSALTFGSAFYASLTAITPVPATNSQTVSGTGIFRNNTTSASSTANYGGLIFNNTSTAGVKFNTPSTLLYQSAPVNNTGTNSGVLTFTNGIVDLNGGRYIHGASTSSVGGTITVTQGGIVNGSITRWLATSTLTTSASAPTTTTTFPFASANGAPRGIGLNQSAALTTAGYLSATYSDAAGLDNTVSFTDAGYTAQGGTTIDRRTIASWSFSTANVTGLAANTIATVAQTFPISINPNGVILLSAAPISGGAPVITSASASAPGTHATGTGTAAAPIASRTGNTLANLTSTTYYVGLNSSFLDQFYTVASGSWSSGSIWSGGAAPGVTNSATISPGNAVSLSSGAAVARSLQINGSGSLAISGGTLGITSGVTGTANGLSVNNASGSLIVSGGTVTVGTSGQRVSTLNNAGTLTVSGSGTVNVNGNLLLPAASTFNQTGGNINVDGNNGKANYVSTGTATSSGNVITLATGNTFGLNTGDIVTVSGGTGTIPAGTTVVSTTSNTITLSATPTVALSGAAIITAAQSVASGTALVSFQSQLLNLTGGTLTLLNPHLNGATAGSTNRAIEYNNGVHADLGTGHTISFGNGSASLSGNGSSAQGFNISGNVTSSGRLAFGNLKVNGTSIAANTTTLTGASSSSTTVTVASTANLALGSSVTVASGTGVFAANTFVSAVTSATTFTVNTAPTTALAGDATINVTPNNRHLTVVTPTSFGVLGNLWVTGTDGELRTNASSVIVAGNVTVDAGNTLTSTGLLALGTFASNAFTASTVAQTVSGAGKFRNSTNADASVTGCHTSVQIFNTSTGGVTFSGNALYNSSLGGGNAGTHTSTLTFTAGTLYASGNSWFVGHGVTTPAVGTISVTAGGFGTGTTVARWLPSGNAGTTITASTLPTSTGTLGSGTFPFVSGNGATQAQRFYFLGRATTTGDVAGTVKVTYNDVSGTSAVTPNLTDGSYVIDNRTNSNWVVSTGNGFTKGTAETNNIAITATGIYTVLTTNAVRVMQGTSEVFAGTHQAGTTSPQLNGQRTAIPVGSSLAGTYYLGYNQNDAPIQSQQSGPWNDVNTWVGGVIPTCGVLAQIQSTHAVTVSSGTVATKGLIISNTASLTINGGTLNIAGCEAANNSTVSIQNTATLIVSSGTLSVSGNIDLGSTATLTQTGGNIIVDGNNNGDAATSVATGTPIVNLTGTVGFSGGTLTIVDPHVGTATADRVLSYNSTSSVSAVGHTLQLGNGSSTTATNNPNGFALEGFTGSGRLNFGNIVVNTNANGTNSRFVSTTNQNAILGNLTITSGEFRPGAAYFVGGNISNNGTLTSDFRLTFQSATGTSASISTVAQTVSGSGIYRNTIPSATITTGGSGYAVGDVLTVSGGTFSTAATFKVTTVLDGAITGVVIVGTGEGYTVAPTNPASTTTNGLGSGATLTISRVLSTANFQSIAINNNNDYGVTFSDANSLLSANNTGTVSGTLLFTQGFINTGANAFILGTSASGLGTLSYTAGGFAAGAHFKRWVGTATGGSTITASSNPSGVDGQFPFAIGSISGSTVKDRSFFLNQTVAPATGGTIEVSYTDAATLATVAYTDGAYTVNSSSDAYWSISTSGITGSPTYSAAANGSGLFTPLTNVTRLVVGGSNMYGTHAGASTSTIIPSGMRTGIALANLTGNIKLGINSSDVPWISQGSGTLDWNTASSWNKGSVPTSAGSVIIASGTTVNINANAAALSINVQSTGTLTVTGGTTTIAGITSGGFTNNGTVTLSSGTINLGAAGSNDRTYTNALGATLNVSGGNFNIFGNFNINGGTNSLFSQSGGTIKVDGNNGGSTTGSVPSGTAIVSLGNSTNSISNTNQLSLTGGTLAIVDPNAGTSGDGFYFYGSVDYDASYTFITPSQTSTHTLQFGDGVSTDAGGNSSGFTFNVWPSSNYFNANNVIINTVTSSGNRKVTPTYSYTGANNDFTITSGEYAVTSGNFYVGGNLVNNGTLTVGGNLNLARAFAGGLYLTTYNNQTVSGSGTWRNLSTSPTASVNTLLIGNSASSVTLNASLSVSNLLSLQAGIVNVSSGKLLTLGTSSATGTLQTTGTFGSTLYINGRFARTFASNRTATGTFDGTTLFPIGKNGTYQPAWFDPSTSGYVQFAAEAFTTNSGTTSSALTSLSDSRFEILQVNGSGGYSNARVQFNDATIASNQIIIQAPSASGQYGLISGVGSVYGTSPANILYTSSAISSSDYTGYFSYGVLAPCSATPSQTGTIVLSSGQTGNCGSADATLTLNGATNAPGISYQWASSATLGGTYTNISGETGLSYNIAGLSSTKYYVCKVTCSGFGTATQTPAVISVYNPTVASVVAAQRCGTGTVNLTATPSAGSSISWYNASTLGTELGSGNSFTTPTISSTTTYYAESQSTTFTSTVSGLGLAASEVPNATGASAERGIVISINSPLTIVSAQYYSPTLSVLNTVTYRLVDDATGTQISSSSAIVTQGTSAGWYTIPLNITVASSGTYRLLASFSSSVNRVTTGVDYTQSAYNYLGTFGSILGGYDGGLTSSSYNYFHNISITGDAYCSSARTAVVATINTPPALELTNTSFTNCGTAISNTTATAGTLGNFNQYVWSAADAGTSISKLSTTSGGTAYLGQTLTNPTIYSNPTASGVYTYTLTGTKVGGVNAGCSNTATYTVTINAVPTITASANPTDLLTGGSTTLSSTNSAGTVVWTIPPSVTSVPTAQTNLTSTTTFRAIVTAANTCTASSDVTVNVVGCAPPTAITPTVNSNSQATITYTGNIAATSGYVYRYRVVGASTWTTGTSGSSTVEAPIVLTGLLGGYTYEIQMAGNCGGSNSSYSASSTFTMNNQPLNTYSIARATSQTYASISATGSSFTWGSASTWGGANTSVSNDDNITAPMPLTSIVSGGFNFRYQGKIVSTLRANINGWMTFDDGSTSTSNYNATSSSSRVLAPFNSDLVTAGNSGGATLLASSIKYQFSGNAGSRVLTIEWIGMEKYSIPGPNLNFQVKLYEADGKIEYNYGDMWPYNGGSVGFSETYTAYVGMSDYTSTSTRINQQISNVLNFGSTNTSMIWIPQAYSRLTFTPGTTVQNYNASALTASNDEPANAITIDDLPVGESTDYNATQTLRGYTANSTISNVTTNTTNPDVWYKIVATSTDDSVFVRLLGSYNINGKIELRDGTTYALLNGVTSSGSATGATASFSSQGLTAVAGCLPTSIGQVILVRIINTNTSATGDNIIVSAWTKAVPLTNDDCSGAIALTIGTPLSSGNTSNATVSANVPSNCGGSTAAGDVWYKFTATSTFSNVSIVPGAGFNLGIEIWDGGSGGGACPSGAGTTNRLYCISPSGAGQTRSQDVTTVSGNTYFIRVYSGASGGVTPGTGFTITVSTPLPTCVTGLNALGTSRNVTVATPLSWSASTNATSYTVVLADNAAYTSPIVNITQTGTTYSIPASTLSTGTTYYWKVTANGVNGSATGCASNTAQFSTLGSTPSCVGIVSPTNGSVGSLASAGITLSWTAGSGNPTGYDVYLSTNQALVTANNVSARIAQGVSVTSFNTLSNGITLLNGTTYYWKVNPINANGTNSGCSANSFTTRGNLIVSNAQSISGSYINVTVTSTGVATLSSTLDVAGTLTVESGGTLILGNNTVTGTAVNIKAGANLSVGSTLGIAAAGSSTGNIRTTTRTIANGINLTYNGTAAQITGSGLPSSVNTLTINNSAGVSINSGTTTQLNVTGVLYLTTGTLTTNGLLTLKSTSIANSAVVAPVTGAVSGNVIVERFIPKSYRAWRDMGASVFNAGSIYNNWQEAGSYANAGYGIFITGTTATTASHGVDATNGLDQTVNSVKSAYFFSKTGAWTAVTNTKTTTLNPYTGYRVLVRGDRTFNLYTTPISTVGTTGMLLMVNATALRATGRLITGNVVFTKNGITNTVSGSTYNTASFGLNSTTDTSFSSVANPYVAPIDWKNMYDNGRVVNLRPSYYYLDPTIGSSGAYVTYNAFTDVASNLAAGARYIQSGQAIFVQNNASTSPSLTITEADKAISSTKTSVFGSTASRSKLAISLMKAEGSDWKKMDASVLVFDSRFSNDIRTEDAVKMMNNGENLAIVNKGQMLSIEGRQPAQADDVVLLSLDKMTSSTYSLNIDASAYKAEGLEVYLADAFANTTTALKTEANQISFQVDAANAATYANRFSIVFKTAAKTATATPIAAASLSVYPNPMVGKSVTVRLGSEAVAGKYVVTMYNSLGQKVHESIINHNGTNAGQLITTASKLVAGAYNISIQSAETNKVVATTKLAVE